MADHPRVLCAVCNYSPVERIECEIGPEKRSYVLRVFCHGDREDMSLSMSEIASMSLEEREQWAAIGIGAQAGVAFRDTRRLPTTITSEEDDQEPCDYCWSGDRVPAAGYWRCPRCDAEWNDE